MHTTEQSKTSLWCPMVRLNGENWSDARGARGHAFNTCIADRCAMWRWEGQQNPRRATIRHTANPGATAEPERPAHVAASWTFQPYDEHDGESACWIEPEAETIARRRGFCGLAGRPEFT